MLMKNMQNGKVNFYEKCMVKNVRFPFYASCEFYASKFCQILSSKIKKLFPP